MRSRRQRPHYTAARVQEHLDAMQRLYDPKDPATVEPARREFDALKRAVAERTPEEIEQLELERGLKA
jgi:hypothetical protein